MSTRGSISFKEREKDLEQLYLDGGSDYIKTAMRFHEKYKHLEDMLIQVLTNGFNFQGNKVVSVVSSEQKKKVNKLIK